MSIPALGGGANQALQRALMDAAERALADELGLIDGEDPAAGTAGAATSPASRSVRRRAAGSPSGAGAQSSDEAIVVELGESGQADRLEVAGGWITTSKRGPLETKDAEAKRFSGEDVKSGEDAPSATGTPTTSANAGTAGAQAGRPAAGQTGIPGQPGQAIAGQPDAPSEEPLGQLPGLPGQAGNSGSPAQLGTQPGAPGAQPGAQTGVPGEAADPEAAASRTSGSSSADPSAEQPAEGVPLDRLIVVLKKTGIGFRDAYQVLREIHVGEPLPPRAQLQARWAAADPAAWEDRARERAQATGQQQPRPADTDLRETPVDDLIRDRTWHHANAADGADTETRAGSAGTSAAERGERADRPTLQTITRQDAGNQAYVAGLSTAEFQRLITVLGRSAPEWFWDLRGHGGLRGLAERPIIARLNTTRIAGTRLGAWILALLATAMLWYIGLHTNVWW
ncbi:hypothetical protein [Nocardioides sp. Iso805N]|uniref:hypothetical protein n=1 Tax=Nocardioides sp. Iso805N TaxID=1283287 RepID=UPI00039EDF28|nr:hypothetical protein [Nocardioides sp. Iso805N]